MATEGVIAGLQIEGDLVITNAYATIHTRSWRERLKWAWHALRGRSFHSPNSLTITNCVFGGGSIRVEDPDLTKVRHS